jgi:hypothetical protein
VEMAGLLTAMFSFMMGSQGVAIASKSLKDSAKAREALDRLAPYLIPDMSARDRGENQPHMGRTRAWWH